jgi:zinc transport system substrate-binding protein
MTLIWIGSAMALGVIAGGCGSGGGEVDGRERVVAAFYPLAFAAETVGGSRVDVQNLTPPGAEPHDLELTPADVGAIDDAALVLLLGHDFQPQLEEAAGNGDRALRLLDTPGLDLLKNDDPHVWLDPLRYAAIVERIGEALGELQAADKLVARLRSLDREFREGLASCDRHEIVTSHEAFAYLAQRYGLRQIAVTGLTPEAEPAPRDLERVVDLVRETGATTVFFETLVSPRIAETVAHEVGARTAVLNPIEGLTEDEAEHGDDYFTLMRANLAALREALGCR